ncbi:MAG TPA: permease [Candidatus Acidoferrum sp.]|nr:permease [Candidatus Acidoferrum sp.]
MATTEKSCCCSPTLVQIGSVETAKSRPSPSRYLVGLTGGLLGWLLAYVQLPAVATWLTYDVLSLPRGTALTEAVAFFVYDAPKVLLLLTLAVFGIGIIRSFFTAERARRILTGKREAVGNVLAALLGTVTPFCSCSAVPLFIGFVTAGIPLGVTFSFLVSAPMVNEVALALLYGLFGWRVVAIYFSTGLVIAIVAGWVLGRLHMERHVEQWVYGVNLGQATEDERLDWAGRVRFGLEAVRDIVGKVWLYVLLGIGVGAWIHGYVPENFLASIMGREAWWSVPLAVAIGIPMYSSAAGMIPVVQALLEKGAALGTVLAFMMAVIGLSFPEMVILRKVLKPRLIATFTGVVGMGILIVGYLFNLLSIHAFVAASAIY